MTHYLHAVVHAVLDGDAEAVSETFAAEVDEDDPEAAAIKLAAWLRELAAQVEQGVQD
jgi:hypothetical protein